MLSFLKKHDQAQLSIYLFSDTTEHEIYYATLPRSRATPKVFKFFFFLEKNDRRTINAVLFTPPPHVYAVVCSKRNRKR